MNMEARLNVEEIESLLASAEIISDDTKTTHQDHQNQDYSGTRDNKRDKPIGSKDLSEHQKRNIQLLLDINATVTVELGRTKLTVRDILSLGEGSIIELNKSANEPVDLIVNNQHIGQGEVVVIEENFGTRVTNILQTKDRFKKIK